MITFAGAGKYPDDGVAVDARADLDKIGERVGT